MKVLGGNSLKQREPVHARMFTVIVGIVSLSLSLASMPARAQFFFEDTGPTQRELNERYYAANVVQYADLLEWTFSHLVRDMRDWDHDFDGAPILEDMRHSDIIPDAFRRLKARKVAEWGIRARRCGADDLLVVYYDTERFKFGITPEQIRVSQKDRLHRQGHYTEAANKDPIGWIHEIKLKIASGSSVQIPTCMDENYATPLPRGGVAFFGRAAANGLRAVDRTEIERRRRGCDGEQVGTGIRQQRTISVPVDGLGREIRDEGIELSVSDWVDISNTCREPRTRTVRDVSLRCTRLIDTFDADGNDVTKELSLPVAWQHTFKERRDPTNPEQVIWMMVNTDGTTPDADVHPDSTLIYNPCDGDPELPTVETGEINTDETREIACEVQFPTPQYNPSIPYSLGKYTESRVKTTFYQDYSWDRERLNIESFTDWAVQENTCHRFLYYMTDSDSENRGCPSGQIGANTRTRSVELFAKDTPGFAVQPPVTIHTELKQDIGGWTPDLNTCRPKPPPRPTPTPKADPCANVHGGRDDALHNRCVLNNRDTNSGGSDRGGGGSDHHSRDGHSGHGDNPDGDHDGNH